MPPALEPALTGFPARLAELRQISAAQVRGLNRNIYAAYARRLARQVDEAWDPEAVPADTDETIERPPASIDDDPGPLEPVRPLEAWDSAWDRAWDTASDAALDRPADPAGDSAMNRWADPTPDSAGGGPASDLVDLLSA